MIKKVVITVALIVSMLTFIACSTLAEATEADMHKPQTFSSSSEDIMATSAQAPLPTVEPTPEPTPEPTLPPYSGSLTQLNLGENYMPPQSLEGIDPLNDKVVALTFDDGPVEGNTDRLLDILAENDAVATFFVLGERVENEPELTKRIYDEGHEIGTHSYDHTDLMTLSFDQMMNDQIGKTNDIIEGVVGLRTTIDRPPYGSMSKERAQEMGREQIIWNVDPEDWKPENKNTETIYNKIMNNVKDGSVVLAHDLHMSTVKAMESVIPALRDAGYTFVTVTQMMQIAEIRGAEIDYKFHKAPTAQEAQEAQQASEQSGDDTAEEGSNEGESSESNSENTATTSGEIS